MPAIRRKPVNAFVDEESVNKTGICSRCDDKGIESILVPYIMDNGRRDDKFGRCPNCGAVIPKSLTKHKTIEGPLGRVQGIGEPTFEVARQRRRTRQDKGLEDLKQDIPKLAGKPDKDLEAMVNSGAIIVGIEDSNVEE
jgi:hypothetical protein